MDNSIEDTLGQHSSRPFTLLIKLTPYQYSFYQKTQLEIQCPEGNHLDYIGHIVQQDDAENRAFRLREQIALISCLMSNIEADIHLPVSAAAGLADLLYRMQDFSIKSANN